MKYLHYSLYTFCKRSKKEMNLSSTGNCRYMYLLPFHKPNYHFVHDSYIYSKTSLILFLKKIQYSGLLSTTFLKWKMCNSTWQLIFTLSHHTTEDLNHSLLYTKTDSGEQISSHTSAKQTHMSVYSWWKNKAEWCTRSASMCHLYCGEISGKLYLNRDTTFNECCLWLVNTKVWPRIQEDTNF
jgi:hypothetical protein